MKPQLLRLIGGIAFLLAVVAWLRGGMQVYYKTSYEIILVDEFLGPYPESVNAFLPGAETLFTGFFAMALCMMLASVWERRSSM